MNPFKNYRIDHLFFRSFAGIVIAVLACTAWASYRISSEELVRNTSYYQQQFLDELNSKIAARLVTIEQISLSSSRDNELISLLTREQDEFDRYQGAKNVAQALANLTYSIPTIQSIELYMDNPLPGNSNGYIQFRDLSAVKGQLWFPALEDTDFAWSSEHNVTGVQGEVPVLSFARKIVYEDKYLGVLVIHLKSDSIKSLLSGQSAGASRMMLDAAGRRLLAIGSVPDQRQLAQWTDERNGRSGFIRVDGLDGVPDSLFVYSKLPDSEWTLVEVTPWKRMTAGSLRLAEVIGVICVAAVLLTLLLTHFIGRQFTKPIKQLVGAMSAYSIGGQQAELPGDYRNEFGYLFAGYRKQNERIEELYQSLRERHEQQRKAEIEALQANINPHFLYNTLDQMNWMAISAGQDEISRILELMGRMFRIGLSNGESFITLEDEITHMESYLEIQRLRLGEGLTYEIEAPDDLRRLFIPKLTLQPFVENAVIHGFNARGEGYIAVRFGREQDRLAISIEDDGHGLGRSPGAAPSRRTGGYGIRNVKERIAAYFGDGYGVTLAEREEGGTSVKVTLPLLTGKPNEREGAPLNS